VGIKAHLAPFLPYPGGGPGRERLLARLEPAQSIGKLHAFWGNFGMLVRAYAYIRTMGPGRAARGLGERGSQRQLHPQAARGRLRPRHRGAVHARVRGVGATQKKLGVSATDIAKRLLDLGFYAPTPTSR
jgi:glycine dehydrogenase subunit 2